MYVCTMVDTCRGLGMVTATIKPNQAPTIHTILQWSTAYSIPVIQSDLGSHFIGNLAKQMVDRLGLQCNYH